MTSGRRPLVLVPQFFGATVFDRRTSRYLPFDHEAADLLRRMTDVPFDHVHAEWSAGDRVRLAALERFFEHFFGLGFFTVDRRFAGDVLNVEPVADHLTGPLAVHLEVVAACNLTCTHCFAGELPRRERRLPTARLDALFAEMAAMGSFRLGLTGGEPLLRRDLFDIIDIAASRGLHSCVTTNGLLINEEIARAFGRRDLVWLNVSLEGATAASNDAIRGAGTFDRVLERLAILRQHARFTLAFTITSANAAEVEECAALAEQVGASTAVFRPLYPVGAAREHLDLMPSFAQYSGALGRLAAGSRPARYDLREVDPFSPATRDDTQPVTYTNLGCGAGNLVCSISVSGEVNPCSFLGPDFNAGNIREQSLASVWHDSGRFREIRSLPGGNPCGGCGSHDGDGLDGGEHFTGGCRARALVFNGSVNAPDPWVAGAEPGEPHQRLLPLVTLELGRQPQMITAEYAWLYDLEPGQGDAAALGMLAKRLQAEGAIEVAATAADRAYSLTPDDTILAAHRAELLGMLAVQEHGLTFRYIPGGCYLMGSAQGDPDERPEHVVRLRPFRLSETAVSWSAFCVLSGWSPPPDGMPLERESPRSDGDFDQASFHLSEANKIRLQYCEDATIRATDWHAHASGMREAFGSPLREDPRRPERYDRKPMVAIAWQEAEALAQRLSGSGVTYRLPTEAEWEAAARGGFIGLRYPWGDAPPTAELCDFGRFDDFSIRPMRRLPPNGYGLYGMSGSVWEWTADWYDGLYYQDSPREDPGGPDEAMERVLRGGSWADCAEVVTVSFRMSRDSTPWWKEQWGKNEAPNIGFRLCRVELEDALR